MPFYCLSEDDNPPIILLTSLENGEVLAACADCAPALLGGALESLTGATWEPVRATTAEPGHDDEHDEPEHADEAGTPQGAPEPSTEPAPAPAPAELPPVPDSDGDEPGEYDQAVSKGTPSPCTMEDGALVWGQHCEDVNRFGSCRVCGATDLPEPGWSDETVARALADDADQLASQA